MVLAMAVGAEKSSAAFVLIDNFKLSGTDTLAVRGGSGVDFTTAGQATFNTGDTLTYTGLTGLISATSGLNGVGPATVAFNGVTKSAGALVLTARANGVSSVGTEDSFFTTAAITNGQILLSFSALTTDQLDSLEFEVVTGSFTANGLYAVPEPTTLALIGLATVGGGAFSARRRRKAAAAV
jgi:hypothetical protein